MGFNLNRYTLRQLEQIMARDCNRVTCRSCRQRCLSLQQAIKDGDAVEAAKQAAVGSAQMAAKSAASKYRAARNALRARRNRR